MIVGRGVEKWSRCTQIERCTERTREIAGELCIPWLFAGPEEGEEAGLCG